MCSVVHTGTQSKREQGTGNREQLQFLKLQLISCFSLSTSPNPQPISPRRQVLIPGVTQCLLPLSLYAEGAVPFLLTEREGLECFGRHASRKPRRVVPAWRLWPSLGRCDMLPAFAVRGRSAARNPSPHPTPASHPPCTAGVRPGPLAATQTPDRLISPTTAALQFAFARGFRRRSTSVTYRDSSPRCIQERQLYPSYSCLGDRQVMSDTQAKQSKDGVGMQVVGKYLLSPFRGVETVRYRQYRQG